MAYAVPEAFSGGLMSDPVTNVEIEDVLSSIRKLVSQDAGPGQEHTEPPALILTEDHRVDRSPEASTPEMSVQSRKDNAGIVRSELERAIEELEAQMGLPAEHAASKAGLEGNSGTEADDASLAEQLEAVEAALAEEPSIDVPDAEAGEPKDNGVDEMDWDAPVGRAMDGPPPDMTPEAAVEATPEPELDEDDSQPEIEALRIVSSNMPDSEIYEEDVEMDLVVDGRGASDELDEDQFEMPEELENEATVDPYPANPTIDEGFEAGLQQPDIDEDMLRDIVADIVRSELQGELGERITRNVRKLVRREINRALAGQDLI